MFVFIKKTVFLVSNKVIGALVTPSPDIVRTTYYIAVEISILLFSSSKNWGFLEVDSILRFY
jgi:hypothetical protein